MTSEVMESRGGDSMPAEDYKQRRRIKELRDSIQYVKEQRRRADDFLHTGQIDRQTAQRMYRMAVQELIVESRFSIQDSGKTVELEVGEDETQEFDCYDYFWLGCDLGTVEIPSWDEPYRFQGLESLLEFPDPLVDQVVSQNRDPFHGITTETHSVEVQVPMSVSETAFIELLDFWGMHGLDIDTDDGVPVWSFNEKPDEPPEEAVEL